jgi:hypothetical protein
MVNAVGVYGAPAPNPCSLAAVQVGKKKETSEGEEGVLKRSSEWPLGLWVMRGEWRSWPVVEEVGGG